MDFEKTGTLHDLEPNSAGFRAYDLRAPMTSPPESQKLMIPIIITTIRISMVIIIRIVDNIIIIVIISPEWKQLSLAQ